MSISALNTGLSAMRGYERALDISAHNVANTQTESFAAHQAQFQEQPNGAGVIVSLSAAGGENDLATETVNQLQYKNGFQIAAKLVQTADEMLGSLIDIRA